MRSRVVRLFALSALLLTVAGTPSLAAAQSATPIKIGFAGPQTGNQAEFGRFTVQAVQLAQEEWNASGGINGSPIQLLVEDDQADPKQTVVVAQKLVGEGVVAMIGPGNSGTFIPASLVFNDARVPEIGAAVSNPTITERGLKYIARINPRDDASMPYAADYIFTKRGLTSVAILHDKTAYGEGSATQFRDAFTALGGNVLMFEGTNYGDTDFSGVLTKVKGAHPQVVMCGCNHDHAGYVVRQAKDLGIDAVYLIGDSGVGFDDVAGEAKTGVLTVQSPGPQEIPSAADFVANYTARWGEPPAIYSHLYYAAAVLAFDAVKNAGTDPDAMMAYLHGLDNYQSVFGPIQFDAKGDNVYAQINMYEIPSTGYPYVAIDHRAQ